MRVALYLRVSTQEQAKEGYSIGEQDERLKAYCKAMRWTITKVYVDPGYSGSSTDRPGLQDMIADVKAGGIDKVVVYKLDRLSRSQLDTLFLIEKIFLANGTDFVSMTENFDTSTPFGRAMIGILAVFAQLEREKIKERMIMGREARAKEGKWCGGGSHPIGYDYNTTTDELIENEYEQMQLRELRELFLQGTPLKTIDRMFHEKGFTHKHGTWDPKTMRRVLRSKVYLGMILYAGKWYPGLHKATLDRETYDKINRLLDNRAEQFRASGIRAGVATTYLGGLLFCKRCGAKYAKDQQYKRDGTTRVCYNCHSRSKRLKKMIKDPNCKNKIWTMSDLDKIVFDEIQKLAEDPRYIADRKAERENDTELLRKKAALTKEIEKTKEQISRFMDLYGIGKFTVDQVAEKVDPLNERKKHLETELALVTSTEAELTEEETRTIAKSFADILAREDFDEIRLTLETLIERIDLDGDDVYIKWKFL